MMLANDGKKGCTHLEQLCNRNNIDRTKPITLEILAAHSVVQLADLIIVYNKHAGPDKEYEQTPSKMDLLVAAAEVVEPKKKTLKDHIEDQGNIKVAPVDMMEFAKLACVKNGDVKLPDKSDTHKFKIKGFSTKKKTLLQGMEVVPIKNPKKESMASEFNKLLEAQKLPVGKPKLVRQVGIHKQDMRKFDDEALLKAFEFANRVERWRLGEIKTQPAPKKLSSKYASTPGS
jgi:hypothetical protein